MKADRSSAMVSLNTLQTTISLNIYKNSANKFGRKTGFKIENEIEDQYQSIPKLTGILTELRCIIGQNLEILTSTGGGWSCEQAQNCVNFDFQVKFDLEGQGQPTPKTIGILIKLFCMSGSNLVILARTSDKLSRGQARDWRSHEQTQATTIPEGQNWPRVKTHWWKLFSYQVRVIIGYGSDMISQIYCNWSTVHRTNIPQCTIL